ncbi:hypothetical protein QBC35DRAFT_393161 [Podospora australis]|uniref:Uncharacterized protein n=1 Tax=Podospora australis TaxID=1536484 RepID=A0AAN6WKG2_9PEZI|nr:hypothetical protein QBC35DRAFT_393161 [Podospora australis]
MATTMTKLSSESFWPTGAIDTAADVRFPFPPLTGDSSSIISPLTLPRGAAGYFDQISLRASTASQPAPAASQGRARGPHAYSPLSPGVRGPALQHQSFLSPHLLPVGSHQPDQSRSHSVPPRNRTRIASPTKQDDHSHSGGSLHGASFHVPMHSSPGMSPARHPRSGSADPSGAPSQAQMIRRLLQQNGRIREAWEAERKYMEANRERAEEVYKEERALMEDERAEWEAEKEILLQEIQRLQQQLLSGGASSARFSASGLRGGGAWEASPESMRSSQSSQSNGPSIQRSGSVHRRGGPSCASPVSAMRYHASLPHLPIEPGQPARGGAKTLAPLPESMSIGPVIPSSGLSPVSAPPSEAGTISPVPIVDVQEIIPELEGIPIKATAIERPTFKDPPSQNDSKATSRSISPTNSSDEPKRASKEQTLQVLAVHESARLTMHAGHTPSHSLSLLTTVVSSGAATTTSSSGESTPTMQQGDGTTAMAGVIESRNTTQCSDPLSEAHAEPAVKATEDHPLRGPLMVRNMPAHDEIFFRRLSDKLEEMSKDRDAALPAVLKDTSKPEGSDPSSNAALDDASSCDSGTEKKDRGGSPKSGDEEFEIPLKIKKSSNFGAPFGVFR